MTSPEQQTDTTYDLFLKLIDLEPKTVSYTVPDNAKEQKDLFLADQIEVPQHTYGKLENANQFAVEQLIETGVGIQELLIEQPKYAPVYEEFVDNYVKKTQLLMAMDAVKNAETVEEKERARQEYMRLNIELYGEPDEDVYRSLLAEKVAKISAKNLTGKAGELYDELMSMMPQSELANAPERFRPSDETIEWVHDLATSLYEGMVDHVPGQETFTAQEVRDVFDTVIHEEFGEIAEGWSVDIEPAKNINVKPVEKRVVIPEDRKDMSRAELIRLVVHEIGVHVMRAITGGDSELDPLRIGLSEYYESEEGLGKVMEQAWEKKFKEAGADYYITAGAAHIDDMNFREVFELKWRLAALTSLKEGTELTDQAIEKARETAYGSVMRIMRGTDELPWFKDLAYYNGTMDVWKFLESIRGDDFRFTLLMMGKMNTSQEHLRIILEAAPRV